jgi:hypothetical protein
MDEWYCAYNGQAYGPYGEDRLREMIANGTLTPETYVWNPSACEAGKDWLKAAETEVASLFQTRARAITPPPIPRVIHEAVAVPEKKQPKRSRNAGDVIATIVGTVMIISFFIPVGFFGESEYSRAMAGDKEAFTVPVVGIIFIAAAFMLSAFKAPPWLRIVYLMPAILIVLGIFIEPELMREFRDFIRSYGSQVEWAIKGKQWKELSYMALDMGSCIGTVIAGLAGIFQKR